VISKQDNPQVEQPGGTARLLVVDDEVHIRTSLAKALRLVGYLVDEVASGQEALMLLEQTTYDLMVLDMLMPGTTGIDVLHQAHSLQPDLSILVLTGKPSLESAIVAVKSAVADYLLKPISIHEIIDAITQALQKRAAQTQKKYLVDVLGEMLEQAETSQATFRLPEKSYDRFIVAHPLILDHSKREVTYANDPARIVTLSKGETAVLACLMEESGHTLSCQHLVRAVWGYELVQKEAESVIRPYISRLRGKLETNPKKPSLIRTIRRRGYRFVPSGEDGLVGKFMPSDNSI